MHLGITFPALT